MAYDRQVTPPVWRRLRDPRTVPISGFMLADRIRCHVLLSSRAVARRSLRHGTAIVEPLFIEVLRLPWGYCCGLLSDSAHAPCLTSAAGLSFPRRSTCTLSQTESIVPPGSWSLKDGCPLHMRHDEGRGVWQYT